MCLMDKRKVKPQIIRLVLLLQVFDFMVKHHKGKENQIADHLSRFEDETLLEYRDKGKINDMLPY